MLWLWAACTGVFLIRVFAAGVGRRANNLTPLAQPARLDLNRARVPELVALPRIGRQRALAIVLHRVRHGPFVRLRDLLEIDGIGPTTLEALRGRVLPLPGDARDARDAQDAQHAQDAQQAPDAPDAPGDRLP